MTNISSASSQGTATSCHADGVHAFGSKLVSRQEGKMVLGRRVPWVVLVIPLLLVGACSSRRGSSPVTSRATSAVTSGATVAPSVGAVVEKPPPMRREDIDETRRVVHDASVAAWILSVSTAKLDGCSALSATLPAEVAAKVTSIPDPVLSELLLNLDGAVGGAELACQRSDLERAEVELKDARSLLVAVKARLGELG
jgi:hypothetical protein